MVLSPVKMNCFAQTASQELLAFTPQPDPVAQELSRLILQKDLKPQNTEIQFRKGSVEIKATFTSSGKISRILREEWGYTYYRYENKTISIPSGSFAKYVWGISTPEKPSMIRRTAATIVHGTAAAALTVLALPVIAAAAIVSVAEKTVEVAVKATVVTAGVLVVAPVEVAGVAITAAGMLATAAAVTTVFFATIPIAIIRAL